MVKRTLKLGAEVVEIIDVSGVQPVLAEVVTECRVVAGSYVCLSLATLISEFGERPGPVAQVCARLRIPLAVVPVIQKMIEDTLAAAQAPAGPGKEKTN